MLKENMFMAHINHEHIDYVETTLNNYGIGNYIIAMEETTYQHMHFIVQMTDDDYHKFSKRVFKDKFKLRGRAIKGEPRQYGKIHNIEDIEKAKAYTCKDGNLRTNMTDEEIQKYIDSSFKKEDKKQFLEECAQELESKYLEYQKQSGDEAEDPSRPHLDTLRIMAINILRNKNLKTISRSRVESVIYAYMMMEHQHENYRPTDEWIYRTIYGF